MEKGLIFPVPFQEEYSSAMLHCIASIYYFNRTGNRVRKIRQIVKPEPCRIFPSPDYEHEAHFSGEYIKMGFGELNVPDIKAQ
jgi:hypothetical protein